uniref:Uncharacterized protein n=1 Tax=Electrophorus electricus TaxID=8005 RepID=A0A4W4DM70_ELEEL
MYSTRCSRCLGVFMVPVAIVSTLANLLLLFPGMHYHYLLEDHVTSQAKWCTGIWISGFVMLFRVLNLCVAGLAAAICFIVSNTGLVNGPLCLHNGTEGLKWDTPLKKTKIDYLFEPERWASACDEPQGVVMWNIVLFLTIMAASGLQVTISAVQILNIVLDLQSCNI